MGLVKEEHQFGLLQVAHFGQGTINLAQQPQQEGGIKLGLQHQFVGGEHAQHALAIAGGEQVLDVKRGETEEFVATLVLEVQQGTLDGADAGRSHVAILGGIFLGVTRQPVQCRTKVLDIV